MINTDELRKLTRLLKAASAWYSEVTKKAEETASDVVASAKTDAMQNFRRVQQVNFHSSRIEALYHSLIIFRTGSDETLRLASQFVDSGGLDPVKRMELRQCIAQVEADKDLAFGTISSVQDFISSQS